MEDLKTWLADREKLVTAVEKTFIASGCHTFPTVREMATKLRWTQDKILELAEDAKEQGEMEINVAHGGPGGFAECETKGDYMLEPYTPAVDAEIKKLMRI